MRVHTLLSRAALAGAVLLLPLAATAQEAAKTPAVDAARVDAVVKAGFTKLPEGWETRLQQDETQRICSLTRNNPSPEQAATIMKLEEVRITFPQGSVLGNWKEGAKVAQNGRGGQFSDAPGTVSGGNCYACHQLDPKEVSYGTLGPSLVGYGRERNFAPEDAKAAFAKVYDAQASIACSSMPRFGTNGVLTEQQIKDVVAYLFDPESPVNK
ncbi:sulfur oxidation c-type cytochrome SoxX [Ancylobacter dichloromethanicus]|uniref:Sulfur oxidation c-type cytochrome SoxX n=1 Tax=Ancylobacter dichloromethanicus TaxID=518825 RepID=A0A9W6J9I9_9HYPH|nr:sulfur oxidation c-type cytochrome SoxX [Ancylobacter dichloromethanicus]MBS7552840.1 sulfur oxidation c-type cytochrome SoxX [Ancylobacter dichloromethanicus]GLK73202.1 sulfur oxidation c-type cytochrome SoxX [Ancylobacter dichloromethanicus]